jgi:hypothetical protein
MAVQTEAAAAGRNWYACTPEEVAAAVGSDPGVGLSAAQAADLLAKMVSPFTFYRDAAGIMAADLKTRRRPPWC